MLRPDKKYSVYDLRQLKGKRCLTHVHVKSADEAAAAESAGIDLLSCSFDTPASQARLPLLVAAASPAGAAWTEFAATAPVMAVAERVTPLLVKNSRSFSIARFIRIRAASSVVPIAAPICLNSLRSKNRSTMASCSFPPDNSVPHPNEVPIASKRQNPIRSKWIACVPPVRGIGDGVEFSV